LIVVCGAESGKKSALAISEIQRAGGKRLPVEAWLRSNNAPLVGAIFE
jgi:hypothetical protein